MPAVIRPATSDDLAAIEAIVEAAYAHYVPRMGTKPGPMLDDYAARIDEGVVTVIDLDGRPVGLLVLIPEGDSILLDNVAVLPEVKGSGFGRMLMEFAEERACALGFPAIRLYANEKMVENIKAYARFGYVETHRAREKGFDRVYMLKGL